MKFDFAGYEKKTFNIMGSKWKFIFTTQKDDPLLGGKAAYCDWSGRKIVFDNNLEVEGMEDEVVVKEILRHELVHAYLDECGLGDESNAVDCWARNEEMIDWIAKIGPRLFATWEELGLN